MEIFHPNSESWQKLAEESISEYYICDDGDDIERLCLYDLKAMQEGFRYKRMKYLETFRKNRDREVFLELKNLDKTQNAVLKRIKEIEEICCAFSDYDYS
ncbi:hypothetical protein TNIN_326521 [Trichonephila inaurata madagascariensis]|uniref:Uncharacterized protein n=1 Tax=Trichonephila inaurata madagascariensis TaxID=2747483 RepID=A0A8X6Y2J6_9ARAC|nr:hypothetical protein TNIN_326521 [Trichonephila inaurata madagascariensis]